MAHKRTHKFIEALKILGKGYNDYEVYSVMESKGYIWHAGKQEWCKIADVKPSEQGKEVDPNEVLFDGESAQFLGWIALPCLYCGREMLYEAHTGNALFAIDNKIRKVIAHFGVCICGRESVSTVLYDEAMKAGMLSEVNHFNRQAKPKKGMGKTH